MFDLTALEAAGFEKQLTDEQWETLNRELAASDRYGESDLTVLYVLERGAVRITVQQNTQEQAPFGVSMTVRYPEVALIESTTDMRRVSCDAADTALILALSDDLNAHPQLG